MPLSVSGIPALFGGVVTFQVSGWASGAGATMTISRTPSGQASALVYSGPPLGYYVDIGDGLPTPLLSGTSYSWNFTDPSGSVNVGPITPVNMMLIELEQLTAILMRSLQAAIDNATLPAGIERATVMHDMPLNGFPAMPFISITLQVEEQEDIGIGQSVPYNIVTGTENQMWTTATIARKMWRVSIYSREVNTREFYRQAVLSTFEVMMPTIYTSLGQNVSHRFMVHTGQTVDDQKWQMPGFYYSDILLEITGTFNVNVQFNYPPVTGASVVVTGFISDFPPREWNISV